MTRDYSNSKSLKEIEKKFTYQSPKPDQLPRYEELRGSAREFAKLIVKYCPPSPERDSAITQLQLANMLANAAIACHDKPADLM